MTAFLAGDHAKAEKAITAAVEKAPDDSRLLHLLGNIKYNMGRLGEASAAYEKLIALDPASSEPYFKLGVCYVRMGKLTEALRAFMKNSDAERGTHVMSFYWMGLINNFLGNDEKALEAFTVLRRESKESLLANFFLAQLLMKRNEHQKALELLQELLTLTPDFAEVHYLIGLAHAGMYNTFEAMQSFRKTLELNPDDKRARVSLEQYEAPSA